MKVHVFGKHFSPAVLTYGLKQAAMEGEKIFGVEARQSVERHFYSILFIFYLYIALLTIYMVTK